MVFKVMELDEIIQEVSTERGKQKPKDWGPQC